VIGLNPADIEDIIERSSVILAYVEKRLDDEKAKNLEVVRRLGLDKVLFFERRNPKLPDIQRPDLKRKCSV
jgi:hypothetical protein